MSAIVDLSSFDADCRLPIADCRLPIDTMAPMSPAWPDFQGVNAGYVLDLYERFQRDPRSVDPGTRAFFEQHPAEAEQNPETPEPRNLEPCDPSVIVGAVNLAQSIRLYGHLAAQIDPLGSRPVGDPTLVPETHGVTESDLRSLPASLIGGPVAEGAESVWDVVERLRQVYCSTTGFDVAHIFVPEERQWLREAIETGRFRAPADPIDPVALLDRLTQVEAFERFLHRTFPGKTRFSIEGLDTLVPLLDEVIGEAAAGGMRRTLVAMAHRGRLNVMAHVLGKPYEQILAEFKDPVTNAHEIEGVKWSGDVKYHLGASRALAGGEAVQMVISMPPNPSHLEAIDPVLEGMARAAGTDAARPGAPVFNPEAVLPILIHGDAAFPGQGVVAETLESAQAAGLHDGRHDSHHREQPDRLHDRAGRLGQHALRERPRARLQDSDIPRQRRRSGGVHCRGAARLRVPGAVRARRAHRSGRLPALRAQRGRRAGVHAAADVREDRGPADGA